RHTRSTRDWSSDVCSSDLQLSLRSRAVECAADARPPRRALGRGIGNGSPGDDSGVVAQIVFVGFASTIREIRRYYELSEPAAKRSEERRVGKEDNSGGSVY